MKDEINYLTTCLKDRADFRKSVGQDYEMYLRRRDALVNSWRVFKEQFRLAEELLEIGITEL